MPARILLFALISIAVTPDTDIICACPLLQVHAKKAARDRRPTHLSQRIESLFRPLLPIAFALFTAVYSVHVGKNYSDVTDGIYHAANLWDEQVSPIRIKARLRDEVGG